MAEFSDEKSWTYGRMPEYLWIGLIFKHFGREDGFKKIICILSKLHELSPTLRMVRISQILKLDNVIQEKLYSYISSIGAKKALAPLTIFLTVSRAAAFAKEFHCSDISIEDRCNMLIETMGGIMNHQSNESTDIRFVALYYYCRFGKIQLTENQGEAVLLYPISSHDDEIMRMLRPTVRSMEMMVLTSEIVDTEYINEFWRCVSEMTDCSKFAIQFPEEKRSVTAYN